MPQPATTDPSGLVPPATRGEASSVGFRDRLIAGNHVPALVCLALCISNFAIFRLGALPLVWGLLVVATVATVAMLAPTLDLGGKAAGRPSVKSIVIGLLLLAPLAASLILGWNREFPYSGDHYFQLGQTYRIAFWWLSPAGSPAERLPTSDDVHRLFAHPAGLLWSRVMVGAVLVVVAALVWRRSQIAALVLATLAFVAWGLWEQTIFLRYPGGGYLLALPWTVPAQIAHEFELSGRLSSVTAAVAWLFLLRPWLIGRWPDAAVLPLAGFLLWQMDVLYYFDSAYLEPWGVVLALLAVELLIVRGAEAAATACLVIGCAAAIKEPFIVALPFVALPGIVSGVDWRRIATLTGCGLAAAFPFVFYYVARYSVSAADIGGNRGILFGVPPFRAFAAEYLHRMSESFVGLGAAAAALALALFVFAIVKWRDRRLEMVSATGAGLALVLLFAFDVNSRGWIGYFRFFLYALPFLVIGLAAFGHRAVPSIATAVGVAVLALNLPGTWAAIERSNGPGSDRNFVEQYDAPLVFPIKTLLAEANRKNLLAANADVIANLPDESVRPIPGVDVRFGPLGQMFCACSAEHPNVLAVFVRYANLKRDAQSAAPVGGREALWQQQRQERPGCLAELHRSCAHVLTHSEGDEVVGALGVR